MLEAQGGISKCLEVRKCLQVESCQLGSWKLRWRPQYWALHTAADTDTDGDADTDTDVSCSMNELQ